MQKGEIQIFKTSKGTDIQVKLDNETVWLDAHLISTLFNVNRPAIVKHIQNIYKSDELKEKSTCSILEQVAADGKRRKMNFYNLDMIISVGYRVNSKQATQFRQWATQQLKDYLVKGYALNQHRLVQLQQVVQLIQQSGNSGELNATEAKYMLPHDHHHPLLCPPSLYPYAGGSIFRQIIDYGNYYLAKSRCSGCKV